MPARGSRQPLMQRSGTPHDGDGGSGAVQVDGRLLAYTITRSARRRKTLTITLEPGARVRVAAPRAVSVAEIDALVLRRAGWIMRHLSQAEARATGTRRFVDGERLPFLGRELALTVGAWARRTVQIEQCGDKLCVRVPAHLAEEQRRLAVARALERWHRARAAEQFADAVREWSSRVGATPSAVLVRGQRRRWGSCSAGGVVRLNWRLVLAPRELIDYVVVHELAHLRVPDHSPAFWSVVARVLPAWKTLRRRLAEIGPSLAL